MSLRSTGNPLDSELIAAYNALRHCDRNTGYSGKTGAFALHNSLAAHKWLRKQAIFDDCIFGIVVLELLNIAGRLVCEVLLVLLHMLLRVMVSIDVRQSRTRGHMARGNGGNCSRASSRESYEGEPLYQRSPVHFSATNLVNQFWNGLLFVHVSSHAHYCL